jgi:hypothetical protein
MSLLLLFSGAPQGGQGTPPDALSGQPVRVRTVMVTFGPGTRDRPTVFNVRVIADMLWPRPMAALRPVRS